MKICSVQDCVTKHVSKGFCQRHYDLNRRSSKDYKDSVKEYNKTYRENNVEYVKNKQKEWHKKNPAYLSEWREKNRHLHNGKENKRRVAKKNNGIFSIAGKELKNLYASKCAACDSNENIQLDHIIPISRSGRHSIGNLQPLCRSCNLSKGNKLMIEWKNKLRISG
jgi:5-methylcytosine-specific restriction endonuclease McrA